MQKGAPNIAFHFVIIKKLKKINKTMKVQTCVQVFNRMQKKTEAENYIVVENMIRRSTGPNRMI
jgi:hypothetical protein